VTLSATASSGLTVSFAASGGCTISHGVLTFGTAGAVCTVTASQVGNGSYSAAPVVIQIVTVTA